MYAMMYIVLGVIYYFVSLSYYILAVMYALTLVDCTSFMFFFKFTFAIMMTPSKFLHAASAVNPILVGKWKFSMGLIHVVFS